MSSPTIRELVRALANVDPSAVITLGMDAPLPTLSEVVEMLTQEPAAPPARSTP